MESKQLTPTKTLITGVLFSNGLLALTMVVSHLIFTCSDHSTAAVVNALLISRTLFWLITVLTYLYAIKIEKQSFLIYKPGKKNIGFYALSVLLLVIIVFIVALLTGILLKLTSLYTGNSKIYMLLIKTLYKNPYLFIFTTITAGVTEELLFRGYLLTRLQILFKNNYIPVIISSVLFGVMHIGYGTIQNVIVPMFIGAVFALYYIRYKNILAVIIAHCLYDYLLILLAFHLHFSNG